MGIKSRINASPKAAGSMLQEKLYREERNYRADRLVEKWSNVAEIGKGIVDMPTDKARNLAILLENQTRAMSKMSEAQLSSTFYGYTPENMLRIVRLSYPNSIRGDIFTEFAMETAHDSIKYIYPVYTADAQWGEDTVANRIDGTRYQGDATGSLMGEAGDAMYEQTESRYVTEFVKVDVTSGKVALPANFIDGDIQILEVTDDGETVIAVEVRDGGLGYKFVGSVTAMAADGTLTFATGYTTSGKTFKALVRYNSEKDLLGQYLGEVELQMRDYHFRPRPVTLGVTWTQLTELVLDTSFGLTAEEMLMDSASQEIKKTLDYQAVKYAVAMQGLKAASNMDTFEAEAPGAAGVTTKDSYFHTAQLVQQSIDHIADKQLNAIGRGGVSAIVGGPKAVTYLKLNKGFTDRGKQPAIGGHKVGELDGIPVFKVPASIIAEDTLLTTWKNDTAQSDVSIAIGTLMPFYSTGTLQRKQLYKEAAIARFEDTQALQPIYLGKIKINGIR